LILPSTSSSQSWQGQFNSVDGGVVIDVRSAVIAIYILYSGIGHAVDVVTEKAV
jgi:hypothetical protein